MKGLFRFFQGEKGPKANIAALGILIALISAGPSNWVSDLFGFLAQWTGGYLHIGDVWAKLMLGIVLLAVTAYLGYRTLGQFGLFGIEVAGQNTIEAVDVLVLAISKPIRNSDSVGAEEALRSREALKRLIRDPERRQASLREVDATNSVDLPVNFETVTRSNVAIYLSDGPAVRLDRFSWQQSWRVLHKQADFGKLREIRLIISSRFLQGDGREEAREYMSALEFLLRNSPLKERFSIGELSIVPEELPLDDLGSIQKTFKEIVKNLPKNQKAGIDITSGTRIYAFAAATAALDEKALMFYVKGSDADDDADRTRQPVVLCYDIRPELQSL